MFLNEFYNKDDDDDKFIKEQKKVVSPLEHDQEGRFSRKADKQQNKTVYDPNWLDSLLCILFISFLFMADFILFAGSGSVQVFVNSIFPTAEITIVLLGIILFATICIMIVFKFRRVKHILVSCFSLLFIYIIFKQFSQYYHYVNIGTHVVPVYTVLGIAIACMTFALFEQEKLLYRILYVVAIGVLFLNVYISFIGSEETHEFVESYNMQQESESKGKKFIYLMLPDLPSYSYISTFHSSEAEKTGHIITGFWQNNNFKVFNRAYTPEENYLYNMAAALNPTAKSDSRQHILKNRMLSEYWRFYNLRNEFIYLKHNELYDIFRKNNFQISAYKSRDFDMCRKNYFFNVNRCVEKVNRPANLYDMDISASSKAGILTIDWFSSTHLFDRMIPSLYKFLNPMMNADKMPMVGTNYNNLYVVNSIKTFDVLLEDMKKDSGRQAYFVFADVPSDMYIYDEFCKIRPQTEWINRTNLPWIKRDYTYQRRTAYLQQTRCLFGKMQKFIDDLKKADLWKDTVMIIQGTSGVNNFSDNPIDDITEDFIANRLVSMAIYDAAMEKSENDERLCSTSDFVAEYLYGFKNCNTSNLGMHENIIAELNSKIGYLSKDINQDYSGKFNEWYNEWKSANDAMEVDDVTLIKSREEENTVEIPEEDEEEIPDLSPQFEEFELNEKVFAE